MGISDSHLRLVDRHWTCGHVHLRIPVLDAPKVAEFDQPVRRGNDDFCSPLRRDVSRPASGPAMGRLLAGAVSEFIWRLAAVSVATCLGFLRGFYLPDGFDPVLGSRPHPGLRLPTRPGKRSLEKAALWIA